MEIRDYDVVSIGSGAAGLMTSIAAREKGLKVCVVSKEPIGWGNTRISGGIVTTNEFNEDLLYSDVVRTGGYINQSSLVKSLLKKSYSINAIMEEWGHIYLRNSKNPKEKEVIKPGGHSVGRTLKSHNRGISVANSVRSKFLSLDIDTMEEVLVCKVIVREGKACGLICYDWVNNKWIGVRAPSIIIACGGGGMIYYPFSDNMRSSTGDGYALGLMAGAQLIDMEQIQFIPFGILYPEGMKGLELGDTSAAGPYGVLRNNNGEVVVDDLLNKTREFVSRKIAVEVHEGNGSPHGGLWLDPTENRKFEDGEKHWKHWKSIGTMNTLRNAYGSKAAQWGEKFEVSPTQHYCIGGIFIDKYGRTDVSGLYAAGETAGGFHGAGRMGSMSLFEALTFGKMVGEEVFNNTNSNVKLEKKDFSDEKNKLLNIFKGGKEYKPITLKRELSKIMWENTGVIREERSLKSALMNLKEIEEKSKLINISFDKSYNYHFLETMELLFMSLTAQSVTLSSLQRKESRGSHYRSDYPKEDKGLQEKNVFIKYQKNNILVKELTS